jgi:hypothetical protein
MFEFVSYDRSFEKFVHSIVFMYQRAVLYYVPFRSLLISTLYLCDSICTESQIGKIVQKSSFILGQKNKAYEDNRFFTVF